jgi:hypothetical protein
LSPAWATAPTRITFPTAEKVAPIGWGDFVLLDLFAKIADDPDAVYADITWCAYTGSTVPPRFEAPFAAVREARNAALQFFGGKDRKGRTRARLLK